MNPERYEELIVKVVDGVASPAEREELMAAVVADPARRAELDAHLALKAATDGWVARLEHDLVQDRWEARAPVRYERAIGVALLALGLALLTGWGLVELALDEGVPMPLRVGGAASVAGAVLLLFSVIRWRIATRRSDPYEEVIR